MTPSLLKQCQGCFQDQPARRRYFLTSLPLLAFGSIDGQQILINVILRFGDDLNPLARQERIVTRCSTACSVQDLRIEVFGIGQERIERLQ